MKKILEKNNRGLLGTILFHTAIILLLVFMSFDAPDPIPQEEILIDFGDSQTGSDGGSSDGSPSSNNNGEQSEVSDEENMTQTHEDAPVVNKNSNNNNNNNNNNNSNPTNKLSWGQNNNGNGNGNGNGEGDGDGNGNGNGPGDGDGDKGTPDGIESIGDADLLTKPKADCGVDQTGWVTFEVIVDKSGSVTQVFQYQKKNITEQSQIECAKKTAFKAKYKPTSKNITRKHLLKFVFQHD